MLVGGVVGVVGAGVGVFLEVWELSGVLLLVFWRPGGLHFGTWTV